MGLDDLMTFRIWKEKALGTVTSRHKIYTVCIFVPDIFVRISSESERRAIMKH